MCNFIYYFVNKLIFLKFLIFISKKINFDNYSPQKENIVEILNKF